MVRRCDDNSRRKVQNVRGDSWGNTAGMFGLGQAYEAGAAVRRDFDLAIQWYQRAARANNKEAQERLTALNRKW